MNRIKFKILEIENFRNYEKMTFNFEPNRFCVITGPNGSGKTTIAVDAICWCLYDETSKGRKGDSVIRKRSGKNTRVTLGLSVDKDEYYIENNRRHDEYGDMKVISKNAISISGDSRAETNKRISDIVMPKDVFKNCLLFSQYINKPFAEMGDVGQKNIFDLMMGFDRFNVYYDKAREYIKKIEEELVELSEKLLLLSQSSKRNKELLDSELRIVDKTIESYETRKHVLEQEVLKLINQNKFLNEKVIPRDDLLEKARNLQNFISDIISKRNVAKSKLEDEKQLIISKLTADKKEELDEVEKIFRDVLTTTNTKIDTINNEYAVLKQEVSAKNESLKSDYYKRKNEIETPIRDELDVIMNEHKGTLNELQMFRNSMDDLTEQLHSLIINADDIDEKLNQEIPTCYACKQEIRGTNLEEIRLIFEDEKVKIAKCREEIDDLELKKINVDKIAAEKELIIKGLNEKREEALARLEIWKKDVIKDLSDYRNNCLSNLKGMEDEAHRKKDEIEKEKSPYIGKIKIEYICRLEKEISKMDSESNSYINSLEIKLRKLNEEKFLLEESINQINEIIYRINSNSGTIQAKKEELSNIEPSYKEYLSESSMKIHKLKVIVNEDISKEVSIKEDIEKFDRKLMISKFWKKAFSPKGIRAILLDESIPILNEKAKELSSKTDCIRVHFSSQKPLKSGEFRNQFCVFPIQTINLTDEREDFSQGEGRMVDIITLLSLRHLLEVIYDRSFNISLFDEILDSLSRDNAEVVLDFLMKMSEESCTILITHTLRNYIEPDEHLELGR